MDKNAMKKYAVWARNELIARVTQKAAQYEITEKKTTPADADSIGGRVLTATEKKQRQALIAKINQDGFGQVMEEVAYTWFNRFTALRFMEVNNYLPSHTRVFTNEQGEFKPQILSEAIHLELDGLNMDKVYELKNVNKTEELFKYLLITQCNALSAILPGMFQKIADYTELLLPDYLLREGSVIERLIAEISEDNFDVRSGDGQIEIIGWLYQYYISEKHEEVVDPLHGKVVKKEEVPAATQLFTTDWVVRYLIDNSVGRYWIERNPQSQLSEKLTYFVRPKNGEIKTVNETVTPQEVTTFDPCVGSGHFLIYAFDVLVKIYVEYGYSERDAAAEIVKNNLFGLDIDGRAVQLAYFSVMMKARQYDRRFFTRGIQPNVYEIKESNSADRISIEHFCEGNAALKKDVEAILDVLKDAKEYGSILQMPTVDFGGINTRFERLETEIAMYNTYLLREFQSLVRPTEVMSRKYAVVATNPPYLNKYDPQLKKYITDNYSDYKGDLFSVFMYRNFGYCAENGYTGFMSPMVWMFIQTYSRLREFIISKKAITTLIQLEYSAYEEATVPLCVFVLKNGRATEKGEYFKLSEFTGGMEVQKKKCIEAINSDTDYYFETDQNCFTEIPAMPLAYWVSNQGLEAFSEKKLIDYASTKTGMQTCDNNRFLRLWHEIDYTKAALHNANTEITFNGVKWVPYNKGGDFRKWYGNQEFVLNWERDGKEAKDYAVSLYKCVTRTIKNIPFFYRETISWSKISSGKIAMRYYPEGFIFDVAGCCMYSEEVSLLSLLALMNSSVARYYLAMLSPTINFEAGHINAIPIKQGVFNEQTKVLAERNVVLAKEDWDSFEKSWDFKSHPMVEIASGNNIKEAFLEWKKKSEVRFEELQTNETQINEILIKEYNLQGEVSPIVDARDVSARTADLQRDIRSLISYAVGCMFGRYSIDILGLVYAGGVWDASKYTTFQPDKDAIIPICDDEYFEDDIVGRFVKFIEVVYGKETLEENLQFIAQALGGKGTSREVIRNYFINDFYADHVKTYQKRPIYWLFDSGKKNGFKCLVYMHRYQPDTIARIRTDYVHEQQSRYRTAIADLEQRINGASTSERVKLNKQLSALQAQAEEIRTYEEKIHHLADQMIKIDLDDGVKHNYEIFKDVLAKIK